MNSAPRPLDFAPGLAYLGTQGAKMAIRAMSDNRRIYDSVRNQLAANFGIEYDEIREGI